MYNLEQIRNGNINFVAPTITTLTTATTLTTGATLNYSVKGVMCSKANGALTTPTTDANTGVAFVGIKASQACTLVYGLDAAGNPLLAQGPVMPYTDTSANSTVIPFPAIPDTMCPFCYITVKGGTTVSGTWLPGTSNWTGVTGVTVSSTPTPVAILPATSPTTP